MNFNYPNFTGVNYPSQSQGGIIWCQGENGAKSYPVAPGTSLPIFDSEEKSFYIKSVDITGRPLPLRIFDYEERNQAKEPEPVKEPIDYITKDSMELYTGTINEKLDTLIGMLNKEVKEAKEVKKDKANAK